MDSRLGKWRTEVKNKRKNERERRKTKSPYDFSQIKFPSLSTPTHAFRFIALILMPLSALRQVHRRVVLLPLPTMAHRSHVSQKLLLLSARLPRCWDRVRSVFMFKLSGSLTATTTGVAKMPGTRDSRAPTRREELGRIVGAVQCSDEWFTR